MHFVRAGLLVSLGVTMLWPLKPASGQLIGPTPYLSFNDSPFKGLSFSKFFLEDFEDGLFNVPGVTGVSNTPGTSLGVGGNHPFSDSVDGDDGTIDGSAMEDRRSLKLSTRAPMTWATISFSMQPSSVDCPLMWALCGPMEAPRRRLNLKRTDLATRLSVSLVRWI